MSTRARLVALVCLLVSGPGGCLAAWSALLLVCFDTCPESPGLWKAGVVLGLLLLLAGPVLAGARYRTTGAVVLALGGALASVALWAVVLPVLVS